MMFPKPTTAVSGGTGVITSGVFTSTLGNGSHGLPEAVLSAKATPEVEPAVALAAAQVSMGAGEEPESGRERGYYQR